MEIDQWMSPCLVKILWMYFNEGFNICALFWKVAFSFLTWVYFLTPAVTCFFYPSPCYKSSSERLPVCGDIHTWTFSYCVCQEPTVLTLLMSAFAKLFAILKADVSGDITTEYMVLWSTAISRWAWLDLFILREVSLSLPVTLFVYLSLYLSHVLYQRWCTRLKRSLFLFVSIRQLKLWGLFSVGWEGSVCNHFPTLVRTVLHTSAALPTTPAALLQLERFQSWSLPCYDHTANILL